MTRDELVTVVVEPLSAEIVTLARIDRGAAVLGLADKLNGGAAVRSVAWDGDDYLIDLCDGGPLLCYSERRPATVTRDTETLPFVWQSGRLDVTISANGPQRIRLGFGSSS